MNGVFVNRVKVCVALARRRTPPAASRRRLRPGCANTRDANRNPSCAQVAQGIDCPVGMNSELVIGGHKSTLPAGPSFLILYTRANASSASREGTDSNGRVTRVANVGARRCCLQSRTTGTKQPSPRARTLIPRGPVPIHRPQAQGCASWKSTSSPSASHKSSPPRLPRPWPRRPRSPSLALWPPRQRPRPRRTRQAQRRVASERRRRSRPTRPRRIRVRSLPQRSRGCRIWTACFDALM